MVMLGIGIDIVEIKRIESVIVRSGDQFARRILSPKEWYKYKTYKKPVQFLAKRFAAKEAAAKAFGTGMRNGLTFSQFEVINDTLGNPVLHLFSKANDLASMFGVTAIHIALTDERHYACATVILER